MNHRLSISIDDKLYNELNNTKKETGISISRLIQLRLSGYNIQKVKEAKT